MKRPTWWAFYQRGLESSRSNDWIGSLRALRQSLGQVEGAIYAGPDSDQRRAKTYGLHFLNDYFPHREIGVCHFHMGKLREAEKELRESMHAIPTSRAKHYLNEVRRETLRRQQAEKSDLRVPPTLVVSGVPEMSVTRDLALVLEVSAQSPCAIEEVVIQNRPMLLELAKRSVQFEQRIDLKPGQQNLRVAATDLAGNQTVWERTVVCDPEAPTVSFSALKPPQQGCTISVRDNSALSSLVIDGMECAMPEGTREFTREVETDGPKSIQVDATDPAGNEITMSISLPELARDLDQYRRYSPNRMLAVASPLTGVSMPHRLRDTTRPRVCFFPETGEETIVTSGVYVLDFLIHDRGGIRRIAVSLNGIHMEEPSMAERTVMSRHALRLSLLPGANEISVTAADTQGNTTSRNLRIIRQMNCFWREDLRMAAALLPVDTRGTNFLKHWQPHRILLHELLRPPRRLRLLERDPEVLPRLRREALLRHGTITHPQLPKAESGIRPAEWILQGYTTRWGGEGNWDTVVSILDTETGEIILTIDIHAIGTGRDEMLKAMANLADKIRQSLPTVSASVAQRDGTIRVEAGQRRRIAPGMRFIFLPGLRESEISFAEPLRRDGKPIQGYVRSVGRDHCQVEIVSGNAYDWARHACTAVLR